MKHWLFMVFVGFMLAACGEPPPYSNLDNAGLKQILSQQVALVDVRRPEEWRETGVVEGSQKMTFVDESGRLVPNFLQDFQRRYAKDQPVALICRTGNRTDVLARHLIKEMGYTQVYNVRDGIMGWLADDQPVVRP